MKPDSFRIAPSLLSADFARLGDEVRAVIDGGADWIHFDVMDNHFVPNLTFGPMVCKAVRSVTTATIDVHLMTRPVDSLALAFAEAGADLISFHVEATDHVDRTISLIQEQGCRAGIALNPATPLAVLDHIIDRIDLVLLMSVNPGFSGQTFIRGTINKIRQLRSLLDGVDRPIFLEVDGGVKLGNIAKIAEAGADTFVSGSGIFETDDYKKTITKMRQAIEKIASPGQMNRRDK